MPAKKPTKKTVSKENVSTSIKQYRYLDIIIALFVAILLISNIVSTKITTFGPFTLDSGIVLFPLAYIFGDILTEVYGFARARRVIWLGFLTNILMASVFMLVVALPAAPDWQNQKAFETILGFTPRIVMASMIAYLAGEFFNSVILAKLKIRTKGKFLWMRTLGSSVIGQLFDTVLFILIAFVGVFPTEVLISLILSNYVLKLTVEALFTPLTYAIVNTLKKAEHEDYFDYRTNFNPLALKRT